MSENKHTPEPMFQFDFEQLARYENGRTPVLLTEEQYRRARACVNACAGIDTRDLEALSGTSILAKANASCDTVQKQRDDLLAALEFYADPFRYLGPNQRRTVYDKFTPDENPYLIDVTRDNGAIARHAIASIKGES